MPKTETELPIEVPATPVAHQSSQVVGTTSNPTTVAVTPNWDDLEEMSITLTVGANPVLISFSGTFNNNTANEDVQIILKIGSTTYEVTRRRYNVFAAGFNAEMSFTYLITLSAGEHTFKTQWRVGGGTGTATTTQRAMQVIELKLN